MQLRKATRKKAKIRLGMSGPSGFGKTYSALLIAFGLIGEWSKIAVIDTENGSADLYSDLGEYNVMPLTAPFSPERYIEAIKACVSAGMECIIIDSITHEWDGKGGCLEIVEQLGGKYQDWAKVTPRHQTFIEAIVTSPVHMITTVRRKQEYEMVKDGNKVKIEKGGLKEITREGFEYELTINLEFINDKHYCKAGKDRTKLFMDKPEFIPSVETGKLIAAWCEQGEQEEISHEWHEAVENCQTHKELVTLYQKHKVEVDVNPKLQELIAGRRTQINNVAKPAESAA